MNIHDAVAFRFGGDIRFGVISEIVTRTNKDGETTEISVEHLNEMSKDIPIYCHPNPDEIVGLAFNSMYGALGALIAGSPDYKWANAESERRNNPPEAIEQPEPARATPITPDALPVGATTRPATEADLIF